MSHIFHSLYGNSVNEVCRGEVNYDGVNVPGPFPQWPKRDSLQVVTQCVLTTGAQSGGVAVLQFRHPPQTGAVLVPSFQVFPPRLASWCSRRGRDDKHCPVLSFGPALLILVLEVFASARAIPLTAVADLFFYREDHQPRLCLCCPPQSSLLSGNSLRETVVFSENTRESASEMFPAHYLSLRLHFRSSLSPLFSAFQFGLLPSLVDNHFTDIKPTLAEKIVEIKNLQGLLE